MSKFLLPRARFFALALLALLFSSALASASHLSPPTVTIKRFTGILSADSQGTSAGQPLSPAATWINFICDPRIALWKIRVVHLGPFLPTYYLNDPRICDHVEILMFYYDPQITFPVIGPVDGTAIYILTIP